MDWQTVIQLVQNLGFPVVCCAALFIRMGHQDDLHREEVEALKKSLDENTNVLTRLYEKLGGQ